VRARLCTVSAARLTTAELRSLYDELLDLAHNGTGHVKRQAIGDLLKLAQAAASDEDARDEETEGIAWEEMTPSQRAATRARLRKLIEEMGGTPDDASALDPKAGR
jgi:hypothetical protein